MAKNFINLEGRISTKPKVISKGNSQACVFNLAVNEFYKTKENKWEQKTQFFPIYIYGETKITKALNTIKEKDAISLNGKIEYKTYKDKENNYQAYFAVVPTKMIVIENYIDKQKDKINFNNKENIIPSNSTVEAALDNQKEILISNESNDEWLTKMYKQIQDEYEDLKSKNKESESNL